MMAGASSLSCRRPPIQSILNNFSAHQQGWIFASQCRCMVGSFKGYLLSPLLRRSLAAPAALQWWITRDFLSPLLRRSLAAPAALQWWITRDFLSPLLRRSLAAPAALQWWITR